MKDKPANEIISNADGGGDEAEGAVWLSKACEEILFARVSQVTSNSLQ